MTKAAMDSARHLGGVDDGRPSLAVGGRLALFPGDGVEAVSLSQERLRELSRCFSELYVALVDVLASVLSERFNQPVSATAIITREAIVPLTHFFMDRLIRLSMVGEGTVLVPDDEMPSSSYPDDLTRFKLRALASVAMNRQIIGELAPLLEIDVEPTGKTLDPAAPPAQVSHRRFVNHNFGGASLYRRVRNRVIREYQNRFDICRGRIPVLSMAYAGSAFADHGFFTNYFFDIRGRLQLEDRSRDEALRQFVFGKVAREATRAITKFLTDAGLMPHITDRVIDAFARYLIAAYPSAHFEALQPNLMNAIHLIKPMRAPAIINSEVNNTEATYVQAAAKALGMKTIGCQHGGHYGYMEDHTHPWELEYSHFDYFITWGWTEMPSIPTCRQIKAIPLPSPWLSERNVYLRKSIREGIRGPAEDCYGFLLMTNKIYRFPPAPSGSAICRSDRLFEIAAYLADLVSECAKQHIRILHKPYNDRTVLQYADLFSDLDRLGGKYHTRIQTFDKGLSPELLRQSDVVLWDQPGTGFLECIASDIPTMIFWPRVYTQELAFTRSAFANLEAVGIVHSTINSLLQEYRRFQLSREEWMNEPRRVDAIASFRRQYGWTDRQWPDRWRRFLEGVLDDRYDERVRG